MFGSLSSCQPSSSVSTSFTSAKYQELIVSTANVRVISSNLWYINSTGLGYDVSLSKITPGSVNPTLHLIHGRTYKFIVNSPDEPFYLTTTGSVEYSTGVRIVDPKPIEYIVPFGGAPTIINTAAGQTSFLVGWMLTPPPYNDWAIWVKTAGATNFIHLRLNVDYKIDVVWPWLYLNILGAAPGAGGQIKIVRARHTITTVGVQSNFIVRVGVTLQVPGIDFAIDANTINFSYNPSASLRVSISLQEGTSGYMIFTPTASTPATLYYRSRRSGHLIGTLSITSSGTAFTAGSVIKLKPEELVTATVTSPSNYLGYAFYQYYLDGSQNFFGVVNKNYYRPLVKNNDRVRKYHNYANYESFISVMDMDTGQLLIKSGPLGYNFGAAYMPLEDAHVILDVVNNTVHLFNEFRGQIRRSVNLPNFPIGYEKYTYSTGGVTKTDVYVLCADGILYRIDENLKVTSTQKFEPTVRNTAFLDNLAINEDIPFKGSFTTFARRALVASLFPVVTSFINFNNSSLWLAGTNQIAKVQLGNINQALAVTTISTEEILNIVPYDSGGAVVTTVGHDVFYVRNNSGVASGIPIPTGGPTQLETGKPVLGVPSTMPYTGGGRIAIPDAHNHRLVIISNFLVTFLPLGDFVPAYCRRFGNDVYVTGHDSNQVKRITLSDFNALDAASVATITTYEFESKVTVVSVVKNRIMAHHYLVERTILEFRTTAILAAQGTGIKKIVPFELEYREGPSGAIGTKPRTIVMLGESVLTPVSGTYMSWYTNGKIRSEVQEGDYIGVSYRASVPGVHRGVIVLGETAIDYTTKTINSETVNDFYQANVHGVNFMPAGGLNFFYVAPPDVISSYVMPFYINFFGQLYNEFQVASNGVLVWDTAYNLFGVIPTFSNLATDVLIVEPRQIYIDYPVDNRVVANVTRGTLVGGKIPGVYYYYDILGEFQFYKFKLIGTNPTPDPQGFVRLTIPFAQTGFELNMNDLSGIAVGQYVSNPITSPGPPYATITSTGPLVGNPGCQVTKVSPYSASASGYYIPPSSNIIYITNPLAVPIKTFSNISIAGGTQYLGFYANIESNTYVSGNAILDINYSTRTITVEGLTDNSVVSVNWIFDVTTNTLTDTFEANYAYDWANVISVNIPTTSTTTFYGAQSITYDVSPFSPILGKAGNVLVQVSKTVFDRLFVGQQLTSDLFVGQQQVVAKIISSRTFRFSMTPRMGPEGLTVTGVLQTTNIEDGSVLNYTIQGSISLADLGANFTIDWPGTARASVTIPKSSTFSVPVYNNTTRIRIPTIQDAIPNEFEDIKIRITNLDPSTSDFILCPPSGFGVVVNDNSFFNYNTPIVSSTTVTLPSYFFQLPNPYTTTPSTVFYINTTKIRFNSAIPLSSNVNTVTTITAGVDGVIGTYDDIKTVRYNTSLVNYRLHEIYAIDPINVSLNTVTPISFIGKFITLDVAQNLPPSSNILFKADTLHYPIEYEVAFYVGRNFQFIEYNYRGQPEHNQTLQVGMRNASNTRKYTLNGTPTDVYSHLWASPQGSGELINLGPGSFSPIPVGVFIPRFPRLYRERVFDDTELRYDVYLDTKIPSTSDVRAALDYGFLRVNDIVYDGSWPLQEGDVLSIFVPFKTNRTVSSVVLSLAGSQFALPALPYKDIVNKTEQITVITNQAAIVNITAKFDIPATGAYMIPDYFRSATGTGGAELIFERRSALPGMPLETIGELARGQYHELNMGDEVVVKNLFTGYRDFNTVEILLCGVQILKLQIKTGNAPALINYITFNTLQEPFSFQKTSANLLVFGNAIEVENRAGFENVSNIGQIVLGTAATYPTSGSDNQAFYLYKTRNLRLDLNNGVVGSSVKLFADSYTSSFVVNNDRKFSNDVEVQSGDFIALERWVTSYHADDVKIYQITQDPADSSNIYTEIGIWPITNKVLTEPLIVNGVPGGGKSVKQVVIDYPGLGYNRDNISISFSLPESGEPAEGFAILNAVGEIVAISLTSGGSGYKSAPTVTINGTFSEPAIVHAELVENLLSRESWLAINMPKVLDKEHIPFEKYPSLPPELENTGQKRFTSNVMVASKPSIEVTYVPQSMTAKLEKNDWTFALSTQIHRTFVAYTFFTGAISHKNSPPPTTFSQSISLAKLTYQVLSSTLKYDSNPLQYGYTTKKLENVDRIPPQGALMLTQTLYNYVGSVTEFSGRSVSALTGITLVNAPSRVWNMIIGPTYLAARNGYGLLKYDNSAWRLRGEYVKAAFLFTSKNVGKLALDPTLFISATKPSDKVIKGTFFVKDLPGADRTIGLDTPKATNRPYKDAISLLHFKAPTGEHQKFLVFTGMNFGDYVKAVTEMRGRYYEEYLKAASGGESYIGQEYAASSTLFTSENLGEFVQQLKGTFLSTDDPSLLPAPTGFYFEDKSELEESKVKPLPAPQGQELPNATQLPVEITGLYEPAQPREFPVYDSVKQFTYTMPVTSLLQEVAQPYAWFINTPFAEYTPKITLEIPILPERLLASEVIYQTGISLVQNSVFYKDFVFALQQNRIIGRDLNQELAQQLGLIRSIDSELQIQTPLYRDIEASLQSQDKLDLPLTADVQSQDKLYRDFVPELISQDKLYRDFNPEIISQDKLYRDFSPELISQDKLYRDFIPELISQDKLYRDFSPELISQDKLYRDFSPDVVSSGNRDLPFDPELIDSGGRHINFDPQLGDSGNRHINFDPQLGDPGNRYIDFDPQLGDPGNRYIDFNPQLGDPGNRYFDLKPEWISPTRENPPLTPQLIRDGIFIPFPASLLVPTPVIVPMNWVKFNADDEQFQDNAFGHGAYQTEFVMYADQGQEGDLGQFQGLPPGTPGRGNLPILSYQQMIGSALLSKNSTYGFGGFSNQTDAALVAAKYVSAGAFQIIGTDIWNYRIYFGEQVFKPRKSSIFPRIWYIRGG